MYHNELILEAKPADAVLETDDIADGVVTTSKLADDSVTNCQNYLIQEANKISETSSSMEI
jgi:hypothetical protein